MISIVMGYHNRLRQLEFTLETINQTKFKNYEVIVVDDFSKDSQNPELLKNKYPEIPLRIFNMKDFYENKTYYNPCIPYNLGFSKIRGDKVIIQNPECCHIGDVISFTENNLTDSNCLSFHCYSANQQETVKIHNHQKISFCNRWYNHRILRPEAFHFATSMTTKNLKKLNGFDERFSQGYAYDDAEFVFRIKNAMEINFVNSPYVIHQHHSKESIPDKGAKARVNCELWNKIKKEEPNLVRAWNDGKNIIK